MYGKRDGPYSGGEERGETKCRDPRKFWVKLAVNGRSTSGTRQGYTRPEGRNAA